MFRPVLAKRFVTLLIPAALGWSFLCGGGGCFNPHVEDGKLGCAAEGKECPDGFVCGPGRLCFKAGTVGSGGGSGANGGEGGGAQGGTGGNPGTGGTPVAHSVGQTCDIFHDGQPDQSDNCAAGLLCMNDCSNAARCYKKCQSATDCPGSSCSRFNPDMTQSLCDVPYTTCNPQDSATGGCGSGFGCWLLGAEPTANGGDKTVCDCSYAVAGKGMACTITRDCFKGLVCPPLGSGLGAGSCREICKPTIGCQSGSCRLFGATWGYCF